MINLNNANEVVRKILTAIQTLAEARFKPEYFTRKRTMPFFMLLEFMLINYKESTQAALEKYFKFKGKDDVHMSQQAFSEARNKFDHSPFEKSFRGICTVDYADENEVPKFMGYKVFAIDGTTVSLSNTPELLEYFGGSGSNADSPSARASIMYDVVNDRIVDAAVTKYSVSEHELAKNHINRLSNVCCTDNALVVFDRGYPSAELIRLLQKHSMHYLMRVRKKWNLAVDAASVGSSIVKISEEITLRVIKFALPSGEIQTLITNLFNMPEEKFPELYFMRWPVEIKYDIVKNKLELENFSGKTVNAIMQDFWICMLLANIAAIAKSDADKQITEQRKDKENKYAYQANVNHLIGCLKDEFAAATFDPIFLRRDKRINAVIDKITRAVVPVRSNRNVPRKKNSRSTKFHHNKKSNC